MATVSIHSVPPSEVKGRDTIARYQAQFRAAAYMCLEILEDKGIDRVYCDYQDDFVVRRRQASNVTYSFYQVKTKAKLNDSWKLLEVFAMKLRGQSDDADSLSRIRESFAGKLIRHTLIFDATCHDANFLTNIQLTNEVEHLLDDVANNPSSNKHLIFFIENFQNIFLLPSAISEAEIKDKLRKLIFIPGATYLNLDGENFNALAREAMYKYSEIDLKRSEAARIAQDLISLVIKKSFQKLVSDLSESELDETAGVGIDDLLEILSISKGVYSILRAGGDLNALKSASTIQRKLKAAGATDEMIEFCSQQKVNWDSWLRDKRHLIPEFELNFLLQKIQDAHSDWLKVAGSLAQLKTLIIGFRKELEDKDWAKSFTNELLLGAVFSAMVRSESQ